MSKIELKPCPFCGGTALTIFSDYMIQCYKCKMVFAQPQTSKAKSMIETWNRRNESQQPNTQI